MKLATITALGILALSANPSVAFEFNWADVIPTVRPCTQQPTFHGYPYCVEKGKWQDKDAAKDRGVASRPERQSSPEPSRSERQSRSEPSRSESRSEPSNCESPT